MTWRRHIPFIYLALVLIAQFTPTAGAQSTWYKLTGPGGDFAIEFPSRPTHVEEPVPSTRERLHTYHIAYGNTYFSFSYIDLRLF